MSFHSQASLGARHPIHNYEYANAAARTGASGFVAGDVGKVARQTDDDSYWVLADTTPTWSQVNSPGATDPDAIHDNVPGEIAAITEKVSPVGADLLVIEDSADSNNKKRVQVTNLPGGGGGEANTASNIGTAGVGVFDQKVGVDLQFRNINAGSNKVTITDDPGNNEIDVDVVDTNLSITESQISDLVHNDTDAIHDNVAGEINAVTAKSPAVAADILLIEDSAAANAKKKITVADLRVTESQVTDLDHDDADAIHDNVAGEIAAVTEKVTPIGADLLLIEDSAAGNAKKRVQITNLPGGGGGEANTASNIGVAGVGVFDQKVGVDLQFRNINAGSAKVTITDDAANNEIDVDVVEAQIDHDALNNFVADEHVAHTGVTITAGAGLTGGGDISTNRTIDAVANADGSIVVNANDLQVGVLASDAQHGDRGGGSLHALAVSAGANGFLSGADKAKLDGIASGAEANTGSNIGVAGVGVFDGKVGADLQFRNVNAGSAKVTVTDDVANNEIDIDVVDAQIDHDALNNFVANEHVDHSAVDVTAGAGLTGGGDITASRTLDVVANGDGSIVVNANDIQVGVLASDAQHGARGGGTQHADVVAAGASGFMTGADKTKLDGVAANAIANVVEDTTPELGGTLDALNNDFDNAKTVTFNGEIVAATTTIDWTTGQKQTKTLTASETLAFTNPVGPCNLILRIVQGGGGGFTITWPVSVKWPGGTPPTLSVPASSEDIVALYYNGTDYYAVASLDFS